MNRLLPRALAWSSLAAVLAWALNAGNAFDLGDEGFRFLLARSWARGESLFTGYRLLYLPGEYVWFGGWLALFGEKLAVLRAANAALLGLAAGLLYVTVEPRLPPSRQAMPAVGWRNELPAGGLALAVALTVPPHPKVLAMAVVAALAFPLFEERTPEARWALIAGVAAGFLAGIREDSAVLASVVALAVLVRRRRPREVLTHLLPGFTLGIAPWILIFALRGELGPFLGHAGHRYAFLVGRLAEPTVVGGPGLAQVLDPQETLGERSLADLRVWRKLLRPVVVLLPPILYSSLLLHAGWRWLRSRRGRPIGESDARSGHRERLAAAVIGMVHLPQFLWERPDLAHFRAHLPVFLLALVLAASGDRSGPGRSAGPPGSWRPLGVSALMIGLALAGVGFRALRHHEEPPLPYPTPTAREIGARLAGGGPAWAGLGKTAGPAGPSDTLITLGWGAGWYALEGIEPGTRHLSTFLRHVGDPASLAELEADLLRPANRWVIVGGGEVPEATLEILPSHYRLRDRWRGWELWEREFSETG